MGQFVIFCGLLMKSGGVSQFMYHLTHRDLNKNTKKCPTVPPKVEEKIREMLHEKNKAKAKKTTHIEEIQAQLRGIMLARNTHVMDKDDDKDEKVYMCRYALG